MSITKAFLLVTTILLLDFSKCCIAQIKLPNNPIDTLLYRLDSARKAQHVVGMMLSMEQRDATLFCGGLGLADLNRKIPVTAKTLFRQASITKLFVALGVLKMIESGKISLKSKLKELAPEIPFANPWESTHPITIEDLLQHCTGFSDKSPFKEYNFEREPLDPKAALIIFKKFMVSRWRPGLIPSYSNVNYMILGYLLQKISGQELNTYLNQNVFSPLNMPSANVYLTEKLGQSYSQAYDWDEGQYIYIPHQSQYNAGNGSLNASAIDFSNALKAYLHQWKTQNGQFLSESVLEQTEKPHGYLSAEAGLTDTYAYGNEALAEDGIVFRGHRGAIGGYRSGFLYNRKLGCGFGLAINSNNDGFYQYAESMVARFLTAESPRPAQLDSFPINETKTKPYFGYYRWLNTGQLYTGFIEQLQNTFLLSKKDNNLNVHIIGRFDMQWQAIDKLGVRYKYKGENRERIVLVEDKDGNLGIADGALYFQKISVFEAWAPIVALLVSIIIIGSQFAFGILNFILILVKKIPPAQWLLRMSPLISSLGLVLVAFQTPRLIMALDRCLPITSMKFQWNIGKFIFASFAIISLVMLLKNWRSLKSGWLKFYLLISAIAYCIMLFFLISHHWFG